MGLFRNGKTHITAKFHRTDLVICSHNKEGKTLSYNQIDTVFYLFSGSNYYVRILSTIDRELLKPSASVALHKHSNALVDVLPPEADSSITMLGAGR